MTEDDPLPLADEDDGPPPAVPRHEPLPPPPEISYARPILGQKKSSEPGYRSAGAETGSHGAGLAAGTTFAVSIVAGVLSGNWIDHHWIHGGTPWATLVMTLVGMAVGFINLQRIMSRANRNQK